MQHAMRMRHIAIRGLTGSAVYLHIIPQTGRFSEETIEHKMCFDFLYSFCLKHF